MLEPKPAQAEKEEDGEVIYRRLSKGVDEGGVAPQGKRRRQSLIAQLAPTQKTVIVGFTLLLLLVLLLGYLSVRTTDEVGAKILDDERRNAAVRDFIHELRFSTTMLDNEARARSRKLVGETEETRPLTDKALSDARNDVRRLMRRLELPPFSENEKWRTLYTHLASFLQVTEGTEAYLQGGFRQFQVADAEIDGLLAETRQQQEEIFNSNAALQRSAARRIWLLTAAALLLGALIAIYTVFEMQRRFRQVRESMEEARRERQFSTQMLEGMVSAVAAIDSHNRIRSANGAFFKIFPQAGIGASIHDKFSSPEMMKMLETAVTTRVDEATYRGRWVCDESAPNCANKTFDVYSSPLRMDDQEGQIVTLVDVTEAVEAESVLRRTESLTAMGQAVAQVAHEIKNPLGSIRLGVSMLRDTSTDPESLSTIDLVERGITHLNKLVVDVTQFSRQRPLELSAVELNPLIESSVELVADVIKEKHATIEKHFSAEPLRGRWDADQLRQVFVNLIANAVDASPEGAAVIITTERGSAERQGRADGNGNRTGASVVSQPMARINVEDRGVGMDERTRAHIFEPFFTTKKRGTGLGLAIVKQIVEQHGGTISVESTPGEGTRFTIELPMKD